MTGFGSMLPLLVALLVLGMREAWLAHRRALVNRALHEARRPLQAIALSLQRRCSGPAQAGTDRLPADG